MTWYDKGFDVDFILQQGLKYHGTVFMPKSTALPEAWMPLLSEFCNNLGYRFVIRQFQFTGRVKSGSSFEYGCWIENVGVAPIYRPYTFALRLTQGSCSHTFESTANILEWLPGDVYVHETVPIPDSFKSGEVMIHAGLVDPATGSPKVRFAVEESDEEGWVGLGTFRLME
jgi:hypothetical protein